MKKLFIILAAVIIVCTSAACSSNSGSSADGRASSASEQETTNTEKSDALSEQSETELDKEYSRSELDSEIKSIMEKLDMLSESDVHKRNFLEMYLADEENVIYVVLENTDEESIRWFTENISNKPYLRFKQSNGRPGSD